MQTGIEREPSQQRGRAIERRWRPVLTSDLDAEIADGADAEHRFSVLR
jgi:hypothetical protein